MAKKELSFNEKLLAMSEKYKTNLDVQYLDSGSVIVNMVLVVNVLNADCIRVMRVYV